MARAEPTIAFGSEKFTDPKPPKALKAHDGKEVIVGIRPEAFTLTGDVASAIGLTAMMVENSGSDTFATFELMGKRIIARLPGKARIENGQKVMLGVDVDAICYFDPATEQRIG